MPDSTVVDRQEQAFEPGPDEVVPLEDTLDRDEAAMQRYRLNLLMADRGITVTEVGQAMGVSKQRVSHMLTHLARRDHLDRIEDAIQSLIEQRGLVVWPGEGHRHLTSQTYGVRSFVPFPVEENYFNRLRIEPLMLAPGRTGKTGVGLGSDRLGGGYSGDVAELYEIARTGVAGQKAPAFNSGKPRRK